MKFSLLSLFVRAHPRIPLVVATLLFGVALVGISVRLRQVSALGYPPSIEVRMANDRIGNLGVEPFPHTRDSSPDPARNPFFSPFWKAWSEARKAENAMVAPPVENPEVVAPPIQEVEPVAVLAQPPTQTVPMVYRGMIRRPDGTPLAMVEFPDTPSHLLLTAGDQCHEFRLVDIFSDHIVFALEAERFTVTRGQLVDFPVPAPLPPSDSETQDIPDPTPENGL